MTDRLSKLEIALGIVLGFIVLVFGAQALFIGFLNLQDPVTVGERTVELQNDILQHQINWSTGLPPSSIAQLELELPVGSEIRIDGENDGRIIVTPGSSEQREAFVVDPEICRSCESGVIVEFDSAVDMAIGTLRVEVPEPLFEIENFFDLRATPS